MDTEQQIIDLFQAVIGDILFDVHSIADITNDKKRQALLKAIVVRLDELGLAIVDIIPQEIATQYAKGFAEAKNLIMDIAGMAETDIKGPNKRIHMEAVDVLVSDTMQDLTAAIRTAGVNATSLIEDVVKREIGKGLITGNDSRRVTNIVAEEFRNRGLTSFTTSDGKELPLGFYASTVVRTKMKQAHTEGAAGRYTENDVDLIQINEHHPTCHVCASRNGLVVSLKGKTPGYPTAAQVGLPPFHPNCRHSIRPYMIDFKTKKDIEADKKEFTPDKDPRTEAQRKAYDTEQGIRRHASKERREYEQMRAALGDKAPKTLGAYRRMSRAKDARWKKLQEEFKTAIDTTDNEIAAKNTPKPKAAPKPRTPKATPPPATPPAEPPAAPTPPIVPKPAPAPAEPTPAAPKPGEFVEAKTIKEANEWAKANLNVDEIDYKGYDLKLANSVNGYLQKLQAQFPEVTTKFMSTAQERNRRYHEYKIEDAVKQIMAQGYDETFARDYAKKNVKKHTTGGDTIAESTNAGWGPYEGVCFNEKYAKDYEFLKAAVERNVRSGFFPKGTEDPTSILTHEFAHQIDNFLTKNNIRTSAITDPYNHWVAEGKKQAKLNPGTDYQKESLGAYAKTNDKEFFAESIREYFHSPNPRPVAANVGQRLEETLKRWRESQNGTN